VHMGACIAVCTNSAATPLPQFPHLLVKKNHSFLPFSILHHFPWHGEKKKKKQRQGSYCLGSRSSTPVLSRGRESYPMQIPESQ
jgi:hypothetical protein